MYKNATYKEKYSDLSQWLPFIIGAVKKDLKNEHLQKDPSFIKKYLASKNLKKVTVEELTAAYQKAIAEEEKGESIGEFITNRWLLKNTELYDFFEKSLSQKYSDFTCVEELDLAVSKKLVV